MRPTSRHQVTRPDRSVRKARVPAVPGLALRGRATVRQPVVPSTRQAPRRSALGDQQVCRAGRRAHPGRVRRGAGGQDAGDAVGAPGQGERVEVGAGGAGPTVAGEPAAEGDRALAGSRRTRGRPRCPTTPRRVVTECHPVRVSTEQVAVGCRSDPVSPHRAGPLGVLTQVASATSRGVAPTCGRRPRRGYPRRRPCTTGPSGPPGGSTKTLPSVPVRNARVEGSPHAVLRDSPTARQLPSTSTRQPSRCRRSVPTRPQRAGPADVSSQARSADSVPGSTFTRPGRERVPGRVVGHHRVDGRLAGGRVAVAVRRPADGRRSAPRCGARGSPRPPRCRWTRAS